jgi:hypothetical protein
MSEFADDSIANAVIAKIKAEAENADKSNDVEYQQREQVESGPFDFACYIPVCSFATNSRDIYERHVITQHPGRLVLCYPGLVDIRMHGWKRQGRKWEV